MESHSPPGRTAVYREGDPVAPPGYRLLTQKRVLGSVVSATWATPEGDALHWTSRGQRKGGAPVRSAPAAVAPPEAPRRRPPVFGVAPRSLAWWIAVVFTVGSLFFVAGALRIFGKKISDSIEKYFDIFSIAFILLLAGGFFALKYFIK